MKKLLPILCIGAGVFFSCGNGNEREKRIAASDTVDIIHYNFIIAPDLSNRLNETLYPKPVSDSQIIQRLLARIFPSILKYRRSENQMDNFSVSFINEGLITMYKVDLDKLRIDFSKFDKQKDRIDYIKNRSPRKFNIDKKVFMEEFQKIIDKSKSETHGADLWSFFSTGLDNLVIRHQETIQTFNGKHYRNKYRNILILLTDGYLEAALYGSAGCLSEKLCYYLSSRRIEAFRNAYKKSGSQDVKKFFEQEDYGIVPANNPNLKDVEVLVLEMYDRSLSKSGNATVHPTDGEILKLFWSDWLTKSEVSRFELHKVVTTADEADKIIMEFVGIDSF